MLRTRFHRRYASGEPLESILEKSNVLLATTRPTSARPFVAAGTDDNFTIRTREVGYGSSQTMWAHVLVLTDRVPTVICIDFCFALHYLIARNLRRVFLVVFDLLLILILVDDILQNGFYLKKNQMVFAWIIALFFIPTSIYAILRPPHATPEGTRLEQFLRDEYKLSQIED